MWLGNCGGDDLAATSVWGDGTTVTAAHELVHAMGAVEDCAPHGTVGGHVSDAPEDLMFESDDELASGPQVDPAAIQLDVGRDDYFQHDADRCGDIADSEVWSLPS